MVNSSKNSAKKILVDYIIIPCFWAIPAAVFIEFLNSLLTEGYHFQVDFKLFFETTNLVILIGFCTYSIKPKSVEIQKDTDDIFFEIFHPQGYSENREYSSDEKKEFCTSKLKRANRLAKQLNDNIFGYAFCLIIVYLLYIVQKILPNNNPLDRVIQQGEDIFNFLSSVFVYLSFLVLYDTTLDENHHRTNYYRPALMFAFLFCFVYIIVFTAYPELHRIFTLVIGILNGLAMGLLFSRFISMEHAFENMHYINDKTVFTSVQDSTDDRSKTPFYMLGKAKRHLTKAEIFKKKLIFKGVIYILPLYVIVQPLFGDFDIRFNLKRNPQKNQKESFQSSLNGPYVINLSTQLNPPHDTDFQVSYVRPNSLYLIKDQWSTKWNDVFMTLVFAICFLGKTFFIFIYIVYYQRRWLHVYLLAVITKHGLPTALSKTVNLD